MSPRQRLTLAMMMALVPLAAQATPVVTAVMINDPDFVPELTVVQEVNPFGQLHYTRILEEHMHLEAWLKGRCGSNWRVQAARLDSHYEDHDGEGGAVEGPPATGLDDTDADDLGAWHIDFEVNQDNMTYGPHEAHLEEVPTDWLTGWLTYQGGELVRDKADEMGKSPQALRAEDIETTVDLPLTFWMTCRRYVGGNEHVSKTHDRRFPLNVTFRGATIDDPPFGFDPVPPEQPVRPIPFGELTDRIRIEQAYLMILPNEMPETCGMFLSASFRTSGPTTVTYQIVDALGARSPLHQVSIDQSGVGFVSHEVDFAEGSGATIGFTAADDAGAEPQGGVAFGGDLLDVPSDNLRGYYRIETIEPHRSSSNIVSYNLDDCTGEQGPRSISFDAMVLGDPDRVREAFRNAPDVDTYRTAQP